MLILCNLNIIPNNDTAKTHPAGSSFAYIKCCLRRFVEKLLKTNLTMSFFGSFSWTQNAHTRRDKVLTNPHEKLRCESLIKTVVCSIVRELCFVEKNKKFKSAKF